MRNNASVVRPDSWPPLDEPRFVREYRCARAYPAEAFCFGEGEFARGVARLRTAATLSKVEPEVIGQQFGLFGRRWSFSGRGSLS